MRDEEKLKQRNRAVAAGAVGIVLVMLGLVTISPMLYRMYLAFIGQAPAVHASLKAAAPSSN